MFSQSVNSSKLERITKVRYGFRYLTTVGARREIRYEVDLLPFLFSFYSISRDGLTLHLHSRKKKKKKFDNKESDCADEI